jgi:flagellar biogenesis protein FliO
VSPIADYLIQATTTLLGVVALAALLIFGSRRYARGPSGPLSLVGRLALDARRAVYLVRVGKRVYALAASDSSIVNLGEIPSTELDSPAEPQVPNRSFRAVWEQLKGTPQARAIDVLSAEADTRKTDTRKTNTGAE